MKLAAKVKPAATPEQSRALPETLKRTNETCDRIPERAWEAQTFKQFAIHRLVYYPARERSGLTAQVVARAIPKVSDPYKPDRKAQRTFRPTGSIAYDDRILTWHVAEGFVSIWTTGRPDWQLSGVSWQRRSGSDEPGGYGNLSAPVKRRDRDGIHWRDFADHGAHARSAG
jgi:hypothetical protein